MGGDVRIGVLADTHGTLPAAALEALEGVSLILHAEDVGRESVLFELQTIAPVIAVRGNTDPVFPSWALPQVARTTCGGMSFFVVHAFSPRHDRPEPGIDVVVAGHTHLPAITSLQAALLVNPGSTSRNRTPDRRGTVAVVCRVGERPEAEIIVL
ncbi:MAG: metallophosphoesterase family protein [Actinomycetota bacterium]|nr:metallophosphoesterase family protein [Actinomycetota bacterium]